MNLGAVTELSGTDPQPKEISLLPSTSPNSWGIWKVSFSSWCLLPPGQIPHPSFLNWDSGPKIRNRSLGLGPSHLPGGVSAALENVHSSVACVS